MRDRCPEGASKAKEAVMASLSADDSSPGIGRKSPALSFTPDADRQHCAPLAALTTSAATARIETEIAGSHHAPRSGADFRR